MRIIERVGEILCFKASRVVSAVLCAVLIAVILIKHICGVNLNARKVGVHIHFYACFVTDKCSEVSVTSARKRKVVVKTAEFFYLFVAACKAIAHFCGVSEIERRACDRKHLACRNTGIIVRCIEITAHAESVSVYAAAVVTVKVEI